MTKKKSESKAVKTGPVHEVPAGLFIGGKFYIIEGRKVDEDFDGGETVLGRCLPQEQKICYRQGHTEENLKDTILHEAIHAIDYHAQLELRERQVHVLASSLLEIFWSNPEFVEWMMDTTRMRYTEKD